MRSAGGWVRNGLTVPHVAGCVPRKDQHRDTPPGIGIGIALKRRVLALANFGTISNVN